MFKFFRRNKVKDAANNGADRFSELDIPKVDPRSPLGHNERLFEKLDRDIEAGALPKMRKPSKREIDACEKRRCEVLERAQAEYDAESEHEPWGATYSLERIQANQEIPIDVELWVEAVCERYLHGVKPMMGLVHWEEGVRKRLYASRGYTWYPITEIYPLIHFD